MTGFNTVPRLNLHGSTLETADSYVKYANDFLAGVSDRVFASVRPDDLCEVQVEFAVVVSHLEYADNFRIARVSEKRAFFEKAARGCCGAWNTQIKCSSGHVYWVGCNYGH